MEENPPVISCPGHSRPLAEIAFGVIPSTGEEIFISACHDKQPQIRNALTGDWIGTLQGHQGAIWSAKLDRLQSCVAATASGDFTARLWNAMTGKELLQFTHKHVVKTVDFFAPCDRIATGGQEGKLRVFGITESGNNAAPLTEIDIAAATGLTEKQPLNKVVCHNSAENLVYTGTSGGSLRCWDIRVGGGGNTCVASWQASVPSGGGPVTGISDVEQSADGRTLTVAVGSTIMLLDSRDLSTKTIINCPDRMHFRSEGGASLHPDGRTVIAGASDLWIREFDTTTGAVTRFFKGHHGPVRCIRYNQDGTAFVSGSEDATIRIWRPSERAE